MFISKIAKETKRIIFELDEVLCHSRRKYAIFALVDKEDPPKTALRNPANIRVLPDEEIKKFRSYLPVLIRDLTRTNLVTDLDEVKERFRNVLEYNITAGKQIRPTVLIAAYKLILGQNQLSEDQFRKAALIAWCVEMVSSYILMMDDIVDNSDTRRGKKSWFKIRDVGLSAINDATIIQMSVFKLLSQYLSRHKHQQDISNVFVEIILKTFVGQVMDCQKWSFEKSTMETFNKIAYNKTGYYTFYFPLVTAMFLAGRPDLKLHREGFEVFMELGRFYQLQNDFLDVYGESFSGKLGTDIQEGKYSWLIIKAIERASPEQKEILRNCYGKWNRDCVEQVRDIFDQLDLKNIYDVEVEEIYQRILTSVSKMNNELSKELMLGVTRVCLGYDFELKI